MDDAGTRSRANGRRMVSVPGSASARAQGATQRQNAPETLPPVSKARWAGVLLVVCALLGAITLAMLSPTRPAGETGRVVPSGPGQSSPAVAPTARADAPAVAPIVAMPETTLTRALSVDLNVTVPEPGLVRQDLELTVARNGKEVSTVRRPRPGEVSVTDVQLQEGENTLTAWLSNAGVAGPASSPIVITVDRTPPKLQVGEPRERAEVATSIVLVAGQVEPEAQVSVEVPNVSQGPVGAMVRPDGTFEQTVRLDVGPNRVRVTAVDPLGNSVTITRHVVRLDGRPSVSLQVRPERMAIETLPRQLRVVAVVTDEAGKRVEGASVVFSLSFDGQPAQTDASPTDEDGRADWSPLISDQGAQPGKGLLSAEVTLPGGRVVMAKPREISIS